MTGILLAVLYAAFFIFLIKRVSFFQDSDIYKNAFVVVFLVKIFFGIIFWMVYTLHTPYQQRADALLYFDDGNAIYQAFFENPVAYFKILFGFEDASLNYYLDNAGHWNMAYHQGLFNENRSIIRFNALVDIFSFGNYHVHTIFMCFLSLMGLTGLYKAFEPSFKDKKKELFLVIFFLPSVLFWGSGVLKEGLTICFSGMLIYHWFKLSVEVVSSKRIALIILFAGLLFFTKLYLLVILLPALIAHLLIAKTHYKYATLKYAAVFFLGGGLAILIAGKNIPLSLKDKQKQGVQLASGGSFLGIPEEKKFVYISSKIKSRIVPIPNKPGYCKIEKGVPYITWLRTTLVDSTYVLHSVDTATYWIYYDIKEAGSHINITLLSPTYTSIFKNAPEAFFNTAFRPHFGDAKNLLMVMSSAENFIIVCIMVLCILFSSKKNLNYPLLYFCFSIVVLLFILIGLTIPILGGVVRYKSPVLPFFLIPFLLLLSKEKLFMKLPFLKKILG